MKMKLVILALALGLGMSLTGTAEFAQAQGDAEHARLRREVAELKAILAELTARVEALEQRLIRMPGEERGVNPPLRFPIETERGMMLPSPVRPRGFQRRLQGPFAPGPPPELGPDPSPETIPGPLDEPRLRR